MTTYLLDTNIIGYLEDFNATNHQTLINKIFSLEDSDHVCISVLSLYEYEYSIAHASPDLKEGLLKTKQTIKEIFQVLPLSVEGSEVFGYLKHTFSKHTGISKKALNRHNVDIMLASTAIVEKAVMVSNDAIFTKLAAMYPELQYENWTCPAESH